MIRRDLDRTRTCRRDDRGFVTAWTVALVAACWLLVGLVFDSGRVLRDRSDAFGDAAGAARAGAQALDERAAVQGQLRLDPVAVRIAVDGYLDRTGREADGVEVVNDLEVVVTVSGRTELQIITPVGSIPYEVTATAEARPVSAP